MRFHLFPFRTEKLSSLTPMVLRFSRGRVGSRLFKVRSKGLTFFCVHSGVQGSVGRCSGGGLRPFGSRSLGSCGSASSRKGPIFLCAASGGVPGVLFCSSVFRGGRVCAPGRCSAAVRADCGTNALRKGGLSAAVFCSAPHGRSQRRPTQLFRFVGGYAVSRCCRGGIRVSSAHADAAVSRRSAASVRGAGGLSVRCTGA